MEVNAKCKSAVIKKLAKLKSRTFFAGDHAGIPPLVMSFIFSTLNFVCE